MLQHLCLHVTVVAADAAQHSSSASVTLGTSNATLRALHTAKGHQQANADSQAVAAQRNGSARLPPTQQQQRSPQPAEPAAPATAGATQVSSALHSEVCQQHQLEQHEQLPQQLPEHQHAHPQQPHVSQQQQQAPQQPSYLARSLAAMGPQVRLQWQDEQGRIKAEARETARLVPAADALLDLAGMQATTCHAAALVCLAASACEMTS